MRYQLVRFKILSFIIAVFLFSPLGPSQVWADTLGERHTFFINPIYDNSARTSIAATLVHVGVHAYFYIEDEYLNSLNQFDRLVFNQQVRDAGEEFDNNIYPKEVAFWGSEPSPGIDNDPKITILLKRLTSGTGGYFDSVNGYSTAQAQNSNQREMITVNVLSLGTGRFKIFLAHEFQHLISFNQKELLRDTSEDVWLNELRSQYTITTVGYNDDFKNSDLSQRVQTFLSNPSDSVTEWPNTSIDYASVTLFGQYLFDRFGPSILHDTLQSSAVGISSINQYLTSRISPVNFTDLFSDWMWANYYNNRREDGRYGYLDPDLQFIHVSPTQSLQLKYQNLNSYSFSLKPWQSAWYQFGTDSLAPAGQNIKISWTGPEFKISYADSSGVKHQINNGDVIAPPAVSNFILMPVNQSKTTNFSAAETAASLVLSIQYTDQPVLNTSVVKDGSLIAHVGTSDIYVVWGTYKRYLAPEVLPFYGLDPANVIIVPEAVFQSYMPSNYIRAVNEEKVYAVWPDRTKHWLNMTAQHFTDSHRDWNSIFIINNLESNFYKLGSDITQ